VKGELAPGGKCLTGAPTAAEYQALLKQ